MTSSINYALSTLKRLVNHLGHKELKTIADGLIMSKIRYALPVFAGESIRFRETDPQSSSTRRIQCLQNEMLRTIKGKRRRDHVRISDMLESTTMLSVNQLASYGTLMEIWKARSFEVPVLSTLLQHNREDDRTLRSDTKLNLQASISEPFTLCAQKLWNMTSDRFKTTNLLTIAKSEAKKTVLQLPI